MIHFYKEIQNWFNYESVFDMAIRNAKNGSRFVEIGVWKGGSTAYMGVEIYNSKKEIEYDAIDTFEGSREHGTVHGLYEEAVQNLKPIIDLGIVNVIKGHSLEVVSKYEDESIDFCFIDGSHEYEDVKADILAYLPKVKKGGILSGHDYDRIWAGVIQAVDETLGQVEVVHGSWIYYKK
jgi:predicted O-methyltransferase YrrM